ncbi:NAD(P)/FAD-dependent oxidoreductase, partial [Micromonospora azadirachtae]
SAYFAASAGLRVVVVERGAIAGGTSSAGEGNVLVSDKEAGVELDLALYSQRVWRADLAEHGHLWEFESKGGLVVAASEQGVASLRALAVEQRRSGVEVRDVARHELRDYEPHLAPQLAGGAFYPQDAQVQPMLVAAHLLRLARERGAQVRTRTEVTGFLRHGTRVTGVRTSSGDICAGAVLNAA